MCKVLRAPSASSKSITAIPDRPDITLNKAAQADSESIILSISAFGRTTLYTFIKQ
jgi:hypothetical protein